MIKSMLWVLPGILIVSASIFVGDFVVRRQLAGSFAEFAERFVKLGDYREATLLINRRFKESFSAFALRNGDQQMFHLPPEHEYLKLPEGKIEISVGDTGKTLVFWYSYRTAVFISVLINAFLFVVISLTRKQQKRRLQVAAFMDKRIEIASLLEMVSHDIRSPLSAINIAVSTMANVDEERKAMIQNAAKRVNDMAESLLKRIKMNEDAVKRIDAVSFVRSVVQEKRLELGSGLDIQMTESAENLSVEIDALGLARVVSNLINNSAQAGARSVNVSVFRNGLRTCVSLADNGPGIPAHILRRIGKEPISGGKSGSDGFGLGLWSAFIFAERSGGELRIHSSSTGTCVSILFRG